MKKAHVTASFSIINHILGLVDFIAQCLRHLLFQVDMQLNLHGLALQSGISLHRFNVTYSQTDLFSPIILKTKLNTIKFIKTA